jgi:uncharacterized protein with PIN domain
MLPIGTTMYCPRCERSIKRTDLEQLNKELKERFQRNSLERGECPVCGAPLIDLEKRKVGP